MHVYFSRNHTRFCRLISIEGPSCIFYTTCNSGVKLKSNWIKYNEAKNTFAKIWAKKLFQKPLRTGGDTMDNYFFSSCSCSQSLLFFILSQNTCLHPDPRFNFWSPSRDSKSWEWYPRCSNLPGGSKKYAKMPSNLCESLTFNDHTKISHNHLSMSVKRSYWWWNMLKASKCTNLFEVFFWSVY